jgi:hypothetical protein
MQELNDLISDQLFAILGGLAVLLVWLILWNFVQGAKLRKMRKKYEMMMKGTGVDDLESLMSSSSGNCSGSKLLFRSKKQKSALSAITLMPKRAAT